MDAGQFQSKVEAGIPKKALLFTQSGYPKSCSQSYGLCNHSEFNPRLQKTLPFFKDTKRNLIKEDYGRL